MKFTNFRKKKFSKPLSMNETHVKFAILGQTEVERLRFWCERYRVWSTSCEILLRWQIHASFFCSNLFFNSIFPWWFSFLSSNPFLYLINVGMSVFFRWKTFLHCRYFWFCFTRTYVSSTCQCEFPSILVFP